jgi:hypothetical protein
MLQVPAEQSLSLLPPCSAILHADWGCLFCFALLLLPQQLRCFDLLVLITTFALRLAPLSLLLCGNLLSISWIKLNKEARHSSRRFPDRLIARQVNATPDRRMRS